MNTLLFSHYDNRLILKLVAKGEAQEDLQPKVSVYVFFGK